MMSFQSATILLIIYLRFLRTEAFSDQHMVPRIRGREGVRLRRRSDYYDDMVARRPSRGQCRQYTRRLKEQFFFASHQDKNGEEIWEVQNNQYMASKPELEEYLEALRANTAGQGNFEGYDPLWDQVKVEANYFLSSNPEAGPQMYTGVLSQPSLLEAIVTVISHEIATELFPATALKNLFLEQLTHEDVRSISFDLVAAATRSASVGTLMAAVLFHKGFHALVCYRLGHRLWLAGRTGLSYYLQFTVSRKYSADIHPAAKMGIGIHLRTGAGVVIGETAVIGNDCSILEGCTLGGTGKETGDRHPKVGDGVTIHDSASILGNIMIGEGTIVTSKSIVTKPVPALQIVSGVPARIDKCRSLTPDEFDNDLQRHLASKYLTRWKTILDATECNIDI